MSNNWKSLDARTMPGHLARRLQQLAVALFNEEVAELSMTPVQYSALHAICKQPGIDQKTAHRSGGFRDVHERIDGGEFHEDTGFRGGQEVVERH